MAAFQPASGLRGLKRSWSGNAADLGAAGDENCDTLPPAPAACASLSAAATTPSSSSLLPGSSPGNPIEWSPSPEPEVRRSVLPPQPCERDVANEPAASGSRPRAIASGPAQRRKATGSVAFGAPRPRAAADKDEGTPSGASASVRDTQPGPSASRDAASLFMKSTAQLREDRKASAAAGALFKPGDARTDTDAWGAKKPKFSGIFLSTEQKMVYKMVVDEGKNVFFTGSAGTGKSVLLREIIAGLKRKYAAKTDCIAVTASTGIAACNVGGVTLHSFAGVGLADGPVPMLVSKVRKNRKASLRWLRTSVLIVDEVSMIDPTLFDKLEEVARLVRKTPRPFGGMQIVVTGDFFQLPPVNKAGQTNFAFDAEKWDEVIHHKVNLTQVFRQKDGSFVKMLNEMRFGQMSADTIARFRTLDRRPAPPEKGVTPTELFPLRADVERANMGRLEALKQEPRCFNARDGGEMPPEARQKLLSNFMAPPSITLKVNAQVMLIKNTDDTLVNGSIGKVTGFMDVNEYKARVAAGEDLSRTNRDGSVMLTERKPEMMAMHAGAPEAAPGTKAPRSRSSSPAKSAGPLPKYPLVNFIVPGGIRAELVVPEIWKNELPNGEIQAQREQIPLILAWAMSIHKSQGQTLPYCKVDLSKVFEKGQAYVAISRATSLEGIWVVGFDARKVMCHPRVLEWSKTLNTLVPPKAE